MQFTPQQLAGAGRYSSKTKIGNWCEDQSLEAAKLQNYLARKRDGRLLATQAKVRFDVQMQQVPLTYSADGLLRFGDSIQLRSQGAGAGSALCCNIFDRVVLDGEIYSTSVSPAGQASARTACARSTFVIERWPDADPDSYSPDGVLRYGDPFLIACNPALRVDEDTGMLKPLLHLRSSRVSTVDYARMSNHQLVAMVGGTIDYGMVWEIKRVANRKYQPKGQPIRAGDSCVVLHRATGTPLACDTSYTLASEFGTEYEVAGHKYLSYGKTLNLILEQDGVCTGDVGQRAELNPNMWQISTAREPQKVSSGGASAQSLVTMTPEILVDGIRAHLAKTDGGVDAIVAAFDSIDDRGNGIINRQEFAWALRDHGISLGEIQSRMLLDYFDTNGDGAITVTEFVAALRKGDADDKN